MRKWLPLVTVCLGTFMLLVDVTIVNVALPDMALDLNTSFASLQWVVDAYALVLAALVLGAGSLADLAGHRRVYVGGLVLFAAASFACGIAPNATTLITARAVQGVGAAAMFATTFALLNSNYTGKDRGVAYGMWAAVVSASAAIGPILGGVLTQGISWRWIFFVNLPVSVLAVVLCVVAIRDVNERVKARVDVVGIALFSAAAASLTYGLIESNEKGWGEPGSWGWLVAAPIFLVLFVVAEVRGRAPMFDVSLMRDRRFAGVMLSALIVTFAAFAALTYTTIWLQSVQGLSPIEAGLTGLPLSAAAFVVSAVLGRHLHDRAPGPIIGGGLILVGVAGLLGALLVHGGAAWPALVPGFTLIGLGIGLATPVINSAGMSFVPMQRGGMAAGALNTCRQLGLALGIAVLGSVFASRAEGVLRDRGVPGADDAARALAGGQARVLLGGAPTAQARDALDQTLHAASVAGVQVTLLVSGVAGLLAGLAVLVLVRSRPEPGKHEPATLGGDAVAPDELEASPA